MNAMSLVLLLTLPASPNPIDNLPANPGVYQFQLTARDGYAWGDSKTYITPPMYFRSQQQAWRYMQRRVNWDRIDYIVLYTYRRVR